MSKQRIRVVKAQKNLDSLRPLAQPSIRRPELRLVQRLPPQAAYRRAQINPGGLTPADLLTLQRVVGNRQVQRMLARHVERANGQYEGEINRENSTITAPIRLRSGARSRIYEQKADQGAAQVIQRQTLDEEKQRETAQAKPFLARKPDQPTDDSGKTPAKPQDLTWLELLPRAQGKKTGQRIASVKNEPDKAPVLNYTRRKKHDDYPRRARRARKGSIGN